MILKKKITSMAITLVARHFAVLDPFDHQHHRQQDEQHRQHHLQVLGAGGQQEVHHRDHAERTDNHVQQAFWVAVLRIRRADALELGAADEEPDQADQHADAGSDMNTTL
jgi:hypothetical protein